MRLTETEYAELLARLGVQGSSSAANVSVPPFKLPANDAGAFAQGTPLVRKMNKTETAYDKHLWALHGAGGVLWHAFEPMKIRLADGAWYTPDFGILFNDLKFEFHETKGFWREAARVRTKVAAWIVPFRFVAVRKTKAGWEREEFS